MEEPGQGCATRAARGYAPLWMQQYDLVLGRGRVSLQTPRCKRPRTHAPVAGQRVADGLVLPCLNVGTGVVAAPDVQPAPGACGKGGTEVLRDHLVQCHVVVRTYGTRKTEDRTGLLHIQINYA